MPTQTKNSFDTTADLMRYLGVPRTYIGFDQMVEAVERAIEDENRLLHITREIYQVIADESGVRVQSVVKNLQTVIRVCWKGGGRDRLIELTRYNGRSAPKIDEFIDMLTYYIKRNQG